CGRSNSGPHIENILEYFLRNNRIKTEDSTEIIWYHAANHKAQMNEALKSKSPEGLVQTGLFFQVLLSQYA
uniref:Uncharacterized protein n=1 Tax=Urocitellus parryii TaxID=9999 RepID=A0A8D2HYH6_UROPR